MSDYLEQTEFLKRCLLYDDTAENQRLAEKITQIQQDQRRVQRAMKVAGMFAVLAAVGVGYSVIFLDYYPENVWGFTMHLFAQIFWVMGLVSIVCILTFAYVGSVHREELNQQHQDCREAIAKFMESRLGKPAASCRDASATETQQTQRPSRRSERPARPSPASTDLASRAGEIG